ncbi:hypothetical protein [Haloactinomyces albus]|uniref:Uncharacterized protein n=1 Tax=Haloactinomyces albus TaxID=1352928 RepID=A0AAE3ZKR6_9ACTN|nr:hypothetical protein [Haloactinomyces albus]MDR7304649.1 hypothetical protein [Haloactinomyces albus]
MTTSGVHSCYGMLPTENENLSRWQENPRTRRSETGSTRDSS